VLLRQREEVQAVLRGAEDGPDGVRGRRARKTPALAYLTIRRGDFVDSEYTFIAEVAHAPMSFHEATALEPGRKVTLRDVFLWSEVLVFEKNGSTRIRPGDILFARVVPFAGVGLMMGSGDQVLPPGVRLPLLDVKADIKKEFRVLSPTSVWLAERVLRMV